MIISRTPFRVAFAGGGSDLREFYSRNGYGAVVSAAIKKYMYIVIHPYFQNKIRIKYSQTEDVDHVSQIKHPIVRECLKKVKVQSGIEIASFADVPSGTGLGSSSAFTVGLLNALYAYKGKMVSKERLAAEASEIEIDILGEPIGKQDQYAAAYGNINYIRFNKDETVNVLPLLIKESARRIFETRLSLYYVGGNRLARNILKEQKDNISEKDKFEKMKKMVALADEFKDNIHNGTLSPVGNLLHKGWLLKKELASGISNKRIDELYEKSLRNGAIGGRLLGAGGTGFLLLYSKCHNKLRKNLSCKTLPFEIDVEGAKILFYD